MDVAAQAPVAPTIPLIDIAAWRADPTGPGADETVAAIDAACGGTGFFVITGHGLDRPMAAVFAAARAFFDLPAEVKARSAMLGNDGYVPIGAPRSGDKEMFDVGLGGFDRWPDVAGFRTAVQDYQRGALSVAADVLRAIARALDVGDYFFAVRMCDPQCVLRLIRAPAHGESQPPDRWRVLPTARAVSPRGVATTSAGAPAPLGEDSRTETTGAHTDYGAITLLATDGVPGLQVKHVGGAWIPVVAPAGGLVVNLGDMLARWTNLRYASTPHRVVTSGEQPRFSVPFFVNPDPQTRVTCIPSCVDAANPCRFEPITAGEFVQGRIDGTIPTGDGEHR